MLAMLILIFVSFTTTPFESIKDKYEKNVPFVHAVIAVLIFLVIPIIIVIGTFVNISSINDSELRAPLWLYCFASLYIFKKLPFKIAPVFIAYVWIYKENTRIKAIKASC